MLFTHEGQCRFKIRNVVVLVLEEEDDEFGEAMMDQAVMWISHVECKLEENSSAICTLEGQKWLSRYIRIKWEERDKIIR